MRGKKVSYTTKQMADACEMLVAGELTLAGVPASKMPDFWPSYDVMAQPVRRGPQRISVKSRTFHWGGWYVTYNKHDEFDWLAVVLLPGDGEKKRRYFIIPRKLVDRKARRDSATAKTCDDRYFRLDEIIEMFPDYENNFRLRSHEPERRPD